MDFLTKMLLGFAAFLVFLAAIMFGSLESAHGNEKNDGHWIRINKVTKRDKVTDDISVYTTIWYKSGTTQQERKGKMIIKPIKQNYRYIDYREDSCDRTLNELTYVQFQTTIEGGNAKQAFGKRRIACDENGQANIAFKLDSPVFKYFKDGMAPRFETDVFVEINNGDNKDGWMDGRLWWLELSTPTLKSAF